MKKKITALLLAGMMAVIPAGCSSNDSASSATAESSTAAESTLSAEEENTELKLNAYAKKEIAAQMKSLVEEHTDLELTYPAIKEWQVSYNDEVATLFCTAQDADDKNVVVIAWVTQKSEDTYSIHYLQAGAETIVNDGTIK